MKIISSIGGLFWLLFFFLLNGNLSYALKTDEPSIIEKANKVSAEIENDLEKPAQKSFEKAYLECKKSFSLPEMTTERLLGEPLMVGSFAITVVYRKETIDLLIGSETHFDSQAVLNYLIPQLILVQNGANLRFEKVAEGPSLLWEFFSAIKKNSFEECFHGVSKNFVKGYSLLSSKYPQFSPEIILLWLIVGAWLSSSVLGLFASRQLWLSAEIICTRPFLSFFWGLFLVFLSLTACGAWIRSLLGFPLAFLFLVFVVVFVSFSIAASAASLVFLIRPPKSPIGAVIALIFVIPLIIGIFFIPKIGFLLFGFSFISCLGGTSLSGLPERQKK